MDKNNLIVRKTIVIVITVALLFTSGFVLGALSAEIKELAPVAVQTTESTTEATTESTTTPTTQAPTTTAAPTTTEPTTEATTEAPTESTSETTTAVTEETTEEEPCCLVKIALTVLELCKTIIDAIISFLSSL